MKVIELIARLRGHENKDIVINDADTGWLLNLSEIEYHAGYVSIYARYGTYEDSNEYKPKEQEELE